MRKISHTKLYLIPEGPFRAIIWHTPHPQDFGFRGASTISHVYVQMGNISHTTRHHDATRDGTRTRALQTLECRSLIKPYAVWRVFMLLRDIYV